MHGVRVGLGVQLKGVKVVQIPGDVVFGIFAVVGQASEEEHPVAYQGEAVAQTGARGMPRFGIFGLQSFPFPSAGL